MYLICNGKVLFDMSIIYQTTSTPLEYIDSLKQKQHILLLHEDLEYAKILEFRFIKNGLAADENCVYLTHEDSGSIVLQMLSYGIPMKYFSSGKMRIIQMKEPHVDCDQMLLKYSKDLDLMLGSILPPFRIVGRIVPKVDNTEGILIELELEKHFHKSFDDCRGSVMCVYDMSAIEKMQRKKWIEMLYETHHVVIHATKFGEGRVIYPC